MKENEKRQETDRYRKKKMKTAKREARVKLKEKIIIAQYFMHDFTWALLGFFWSFMNLA